MLLAKALFLALSVTASADDAPVAPSSPPSPVSAHGEAATETVSAGPLFSPEGPGRGRYRIGVGLQLELLPVTLVESEQREIPELATEFRYGLPYGLSLDARIHGVFIKNEADLGAAWCLRLGEVKLAVLLGQGLRFGKLSSEAFAAASWGFVTRPGWSIGIPWRNLRFAFTEEFLFSQNQHVRMGDISTVFRQNFAFEGFATTTTVETIFPGGGILYFGFGLNWTSNYDQAWLAVSDAHTSRAFFPKLLAGYAF